MPFVKELPKRKEFKKVKFMEFPVGQHIIRLLNPETAQMYFVHYVAKSRLSVVCLEDGCPLCEANRKIYTADSKNYSKNPDYASRSRRYAINVLDKTPAKICPSCGAENKKLGANFPATCTACNTSIMDVPGKPLNVVKVLSKGVRFFEMLDGIESATLGEDGSPVGLANFDLQVVVTQPKADPMIIPLPGNREKVEVPEEQLYSLSDAFIKLDANEIKDMLKGVSLKDIFLARKVDSAVVETATEMQEAEKLGSKVEEEIEKLFNS